ncbi:hypothetical protein Q5752_002149 [Cryptotrichosporon argae]
MDSPVTSSSSRQAWPPLSERPTSLVLAGSSGPSSTASPSGSTKRHPKKSRDDDDDGSAEKAKRTKTGRACDACRTKKIRCDILEPTPRSGEDDAQPLCAHCRQAGLECSFHLPITETRFKKKKQDDVLGFSEGSRGASPQPEDRHGRVEGPTSIPFLLHTTLSPTYIQQYDINNHTHWEVTDDGAGVIRIHAPPDSNDDPAKPVLSPSTISRLVNAYFDHLAHLFPIVLRSEFIRKKPNPLLLYAICGVASTMRQFPREVFAQVRRMVNGLLKSNDIMSDARFEHVQALLLLAQVGDLHAQPTAATASASLMRTTAAIRMAQDLGLHRESSLKGQTAQDLVHVELRRRVWATCVILDRWYGAALGVPLVIDLYDCDILLPLNRDVVVDRDPADWPANKSYAFLTEHLSLSLLIGRIIKTVYSPTGLKFATDEQLRSILEDTTNWKDSLPAHLQFRGNTSSHAAGLLYLAHAALQFLLWRVFMRITHILPPHLTFTLDTDRWSKLIDWSRQAIFWLKHNDAALDSVFIFPYAATSCALIQYHSWARRGDPCALDTLRIVKETVERWAQTVQPDQMSIRRKTCETMTLLYEAALRTNTEGTTSRDRPSAAPTAGVQVRHDFGQTVFRADASLPGGGIWVAHDEQQAQAAGLPLYDVVLEGQRPQPRAPRAPPALPEVDILEDLQLHSTNLNPHVSTGGLADSHAGPAPPPPPGVNGSNNSFEPPFAVPTNPLDVNLLDSMPDAHFDWNQWGQYFDTINRVHAGAAEPFYHV